MVVSELSSVAGASTDKSRFSKGYSGTQGGLISATAIVDSYIDLSIIGFELDIADDFSLSIANDWIPLDLSSTVVGGGGCKSKK